MLTSFFGSSADKVDVFIAIGVDWSINIFPQSHKCNRTHTITPYLQQLLWVLQEVETIFDPTSCNLSSLLSELLPALTLRLTWVTQRQKEILRYAGRKGKNDWYIWMEFDGRKEKSVLFTPPLTDYSLINLQITRQMIEKICFVSRVC